MDLFCLFNLIFLALYIVKEVHPYDMVKKISGKDVRYMFKDIPPRLKKNLPWAISDYWEWLRCKFPWPWTWFRRRKPKTRRMGEDDNFDLRDEESKINFTIERNGIIHTYEHENTTDIQEPYNQMKQQMRYNIKSNPGNGDHELVHSFNSVHNRKDFEAFYDDSGSVDYSENKNKNSDKDKIINSKQLNYGKLEQLNAKRQFFKNQASYQKEFHENDINDIKTSRFYMNIPSSNYSHNKQIELQNKYKNGASQNNVSDYIDYDLFDSLNTFHDHKDIVNRSISHDDAIKNNKMNRANQLRKYNSVILEANRQLSRNKYGYQSNKNNQNIKQFKNPEDFEDTHTSINNHKYYNNRNKENYYQNRKYGVDSNPVTRQNEYKSMSGQSKDDSVHATRESDYLFQTKNKLFGKKTDKETYLKYHGSDGRHIPSPLNEYNKDGTDDFYHRKYNFEESKELIRLLHEYEIQNDIDRNRGIQDQIADQSPHNYKESQQNFHDISKTTYFTIEPYLNEEDITPKSKTKNRIKKIQAEEYFNSYDEVTESRPKTYEEYYEDDKVVPGLKYHI